jgi:fatty-acyl-CoA synthase
MSELVTPPSGGAPAHTPTAPLPVLSYSNGAFAVPLLGETIGVNLVRTAAALPDHEALVECATGRRWAYRELVAEVDAVAIGLHTRGLGKGDRIGIWAPNCAEWVFVQYAAARLGAILVNVNPAYRTHELAHVLRQSGVSILVASPSFKTSDYRSVVAEVRADCPDLRHAVFLGDPDWDELVAAGRAGDRSLLAERAAELSADDPVNIQYTSGTTGAPKGATLTHHGLLNNAFFFGETLRYTERDRVCVPVPLYHCFGMGMANIGCTSHGATIVLPSPGFDPKLTLEAVQAERCTALYGVPTMFIAELSLPDFAEYDLTTLRTGIMGGSPCPVEIMKRVITEMHLSEITIAYGMTETSPVATQTHVDDDLHRRTATVGSAHPHVEIKVVDPVTGVTVPRNTPGEVCTRGYNVMLGYWNQPEETAKSIDAARWMHTGDLGVMDDSDYVSIVGRIKDMIIRGGENIYPREIEEFLFTHPDIVEAQIIGVPDTRYGEEVMAWIRLRPGAETITVETLKQYCTGKIAHYKVPRYVKVVDEFPMTVTGKIRKAEMRATSTEEMGRTACS